MSTGSTIDASIGFAEEVYTNEVQTITITGTPTGGTFTLTYDGATTSAIAYNAAAATVQAALEALPNIGTGGVVGAGGSLPGTPVTITFSGALLSKRNVSLMTATGSLTGGSSPAVSVATTTGGTGYGDYVAPTRFLEFVSEDIKVNLGHIESKSLRKSNRVLRSDRRIANKIGAAGSIELEVANKGFGLIFKHLLGSVAITTPGGATLTRLHTHTLGDNWNQSLTTQVGRPDVNGTIRPFSYLGGKILNGELSNDVDSLLMLKLGLDFKDEDTTQSLASVSYPSSQSLLSYIGGRVTIDGGYFDVRAPRISIERDYKTDRRYVRSSALKKEPIDKGLTKITGSFETDFENLTAYNKFINGTIAAVTMTWQGDLIEGSFYYKLVATMPAVQFDGETPTVGNGDDTVAQPLPFTVLNDGTNEPIKIEIYTTDTTS